MTLLEKIDSPADLKKLSQEQLDTLCIELRLYIIDVVHKIGGHFGSSLGATELTVALHYLYNTPKDKIVWDVGHQAYGHKVLTGRREDLKTIRQPHPGYLPERRIWLLRSSRIHPRTYPPLLGRLT